MMRFMFSTSDEVEWESGLSNHRPLGSGSLSDVDRSLFSSNRGQTPTLSGRLRASALVSRHKTQQVGRIPVSSLQMHLQSVQQFNQTKPTQTSQTPVKILKARFAGDLSTREAYEQMRRDLDG